MSQYIGRFAPSPTGPLHMGSLVAAVGSYLRARQQNGRWLMRMEDLDPLREVDGAADEILNMLEAHALHWDGEVIYQSQRHEIYQEVLQQLLSEGFAYACSCSRKFLKRTAVIGNQGVIYPRTCRDLNNPVNDSTAIRVRTTDDPICFQDYRLGQQCQSLESEVGDFIIRRSDGYFAYQLAVVVDDELQAITEVVRGEDLLGNTQRQIYLQQILGYHQPDYYHLPLMKNELGQKLSKQTHAPALQAGQASTNLLAALAFLGVYDPEKDSEALLHEQPETIMEWAQLNYIDKC